MKTTGTQPNLEILFEDNHLLAVNKPAGVLSQEDHTGKPDLLRLCKEYLQKTSNNYREPFLGLLHRLDKPVSGVMLFAKTSKAAARISEQIRKRSIKKTYLTVVEGSPPKNGMLQDYLLKDSRTNTVSVASVQNRQAKKAELIYLNLAAKNNLSLLKVTLITGRPHQIRVQLSHLGYPILNDKKYGSKSNGSLLLHASELAFEHPTLKSKTIVKCTPPYTDAWKLFEGITKDS